VRVVGLRVCKVQVGGNVGMLFLTVNTRNLIKTLSKSVLLQDLKVIMTVEKCNLKSKDICCLLNTLQYIHERLIAAI